MVHAEKKTHVEAAAFCVSKEGTLLKEGSSDGVALAKKAGIEDMWMGALDAEDADKEKSFVCEANCHEGKLLNSKLHT